MRHAILIASLLLSGCVPSQAPTRASLFTREQAVAAAVKIASNSAPEISGALSPPGNIQAERMTLAEALQRMSGDAKLPPGYSADAPVWYVTMDGLWASEALAPGVTATQRPYHHYRVILDARTGTDIESSLTPEEP